MNWFKIGIVYFKIVGILILFFSVIGIFTQSFDPSGFLKEQISLDLYGTTQLPEVAQKAFAFPFMLFCLASVLLGIMQYYIVQYPLANKERGAYYVMWACTLIWIIGAWLISMYIGTKAYLHYSVATMVVVMVPPLLLVRSEFSKRK